MNKRTRNPQDKEAPPAVGTALDTLAEYYGEGDSNDSAKTPPQISDSPHSDGESQPSKKSCSTADEPGVVLSPTSLALTPECSESSSNTLVPTQSPRTSSVEPQSAPPQPPSANPSPSTALGQNRRAASSSATVYHCDHCAYSHHLVTEYARHLRTIHNSNWKPGPREPDLEHCPWGTLYVREGGFHTVTPQPVPVLGGGSPPPGASPWMLLPWLL